MDPLALGAVATITVGLATAVGAWVGKRGENRANHQGVLMTGYGGLVNELQEERATLRQELTAAYAELAGERANKAELQAQIAQLQAAIADRDRQIAALGGPTP